MTKSAIPEEHLLFVPHDTALINCPYNWQVLYNEGAKTIEAKRADLFQGKILALAVLLPGLVSLVVFPPINLLPHNLSNDLIFANIAVAFVVLVMFSSLILFPAYAFSVNSSYWKGPCAPIRFRYSIDDETFFFSRENVYYQKCDIKRVVVGEVRGYSTRHLSSEYDGDRAFSRKEFAQCVVLLQDNDEQWHRHELSLDYHYLFDDKGSKPFIKLAELLKPLTECEVVIRRYTFKECYRQQRCEKINMIDPDSSKILW